MKPPSKTHALASGYARQRAVCNPYLDFEPALTDVLREVTCRKCRAMLAGIQRNVERIGRTS
jgi:hypothetical protein